MSRKKVISSAVSLILIAAMLTVLPTAAAAADDYVDRFNDINRSDWFYSNVIMLTEMGVVNGYPDGTFLPQSYVTCAEYTKMLTAILGYSIVDENGYYTYNVGDSELPDYFNTINVHWSYPYVRLAYENGIITRSELGETFKCDAVITRSLMVRMLVRALKLELYPGANTFADYADKYAVTALHEYLLRGYVENGERYFKGGGLTTRAEASTVVLRAYEYSLDPTGYKTNEIISNASKYQVNDDVELIDLFTAVNRSYADSIVLETDIDFADWTAVYTLAAGMYPEYFISRGFYCNYLVDSGRFVVNIQYSALKTVMELQQSKTMAAVDKAAAEILERFAEYVPPASDEETVKTDDGSYIIEAEKTENESELTDIYSELSEKNLLRAAHDYLIGQCGYDYTERDTGYVNMQSHTAYGAMVDHKAVCQGYSAAMNLLCDALGIRSYSITGLAPGSLDAHIWNAVLLDGEIYFTDATFDDPDGGSISKYRLMSAEDLKAFGYTWDKNTVKLEYFYIAN